MRVSVALVFLICFVSVQCSKLRKDADYWKTLAQNELNEALGVNLNTNVAKNVLLFIGDGMGPNTVTATRIHKGGESHRLTYEKFPHVGLLKTYSANKMVPDSASTATALLCGVKANQDTIGVDATVEHFDCDASLKDSARLDSLAALALRAGKSAGFVTTMRVTHATPAPMYAHSPAREWECDAAVPHGNCKDIARQMVEDWPGRDLHVILGGGRQGLIPNATGTATDPISAWGCSRQDGRDLMQQYRDDKAARGLKYQVVENYGQLRNVDYDNTDYLLGIFSNAHLKYKYEKSLAADGTPSMVYMTEAAIRVMRKNPNGFFLMVEGGNIDMAHHRGRARTAVSEASDLEDAVAAALQLVDPAETLVVVTADHTHTLNINGYPDRGSDIFGVIGPSPYDHKNYTTLAYGTGGPGSVQYTVENDTLVRRDPSQDDTTDYLYEQIAAVPLDENGHGGGDVTIYAQGPFAHLFHNVHEQHYAQHAIAYAARIGPHAHSHANAHSHAQYTRPSVAMLLAILLVYYR